MADTIRDGVAVASGTAAHAATHTNGTDDIQSATNGQKGLATASHIATIESHTASIATNTADIAALDASVDSLSDSVADHPVLDTTHSPAVLYTFDGVLTDQGSAAATLALSAGTARYMNSFGAGQKSMFFDGLTRFKANSNAGFQLTGDMTLQVLMALRAYATQCVCMLYDPARPNTEAYNILYGLELLSGIPQYFAEYGVGTNITYQLTGYKVPLYQWFLIGFTRTAGQVQFYLNGGTMGAVSVGLAAPTGGTSSPLYVGDYGDNSGLLNGDIAAVKVVNRAMTPSEMLAEAQRCGVPR